MTLQAAIDAANAGDTVTLLTDVTVSEAVTIDKAITLDLDGKTLSAEQLDVTGDATIKNGTVVGTDYGIFVDTTGKVTINDTNVTGGCYIAIHIEKGTVEFTGGTLTTVDGDASVRLSQVSSDNKFIMNDGTINGWVDMWDGTFEMHGGTIDASGTIVWYQNPPSIWVEPKGTLIMTGGTLKAAEGVDVIDFYGTLNASISGGIFSTEIPAEYCAEGYICIPYGEKYIVTKYIEPKVATVTIDGVTSEVMSLTDAFAEAKANPKAGAIITLTDSVELPHWDAPVMDGVSFTLDGNGKTITGLPCALIESATTGGKTVTVKNLTIDGATNAGALSSHSGVVNAGALFNVVGYCYITLEGISVVNSTVGGDSTYYAGGLIGYVAATGESVLNITGCAVKDSTISATSSSGGLFGHSNGGLTTVTGTEVGGNNLKGGSSQKEGALIGTLTGSAGTKIAVTETEKSVGTDTLNVIGRVYTNVTYNGGEYFTDPRTASATNDNTDIIIEDKVVKNEEGKFFIYAEPKVATVTVDGVTSEVMSLTDAFAEAKANPKAGATIKLIANVELPHWDAPVMDGVSFTLNGNNKTITGLTQPLIKSAATGSASVTIKNLTIQGANIVGLESTHSGVRNAAALIGVAGYYDITLSSVKVLDSTIGTAEDYYAGALVGYWCGQGTLTVSKATVTGNTITAESSVGGLIGHSNDGITVTGTTVGGNTAKTTGDDPTKVGSLIGTALGTANKIDVTENAVSNLYQGDTAVALHIIGRRRGDVHFTGGTYYSDPELTANGNGAVTADGEIVKTGEVWIIAKASAQVGENEVEYFVSLSEAIKAANAATEPTTVKLLTNISDSSRLTVNADKTVTLDLGGFTWKSSGGMAGHGPLTNKGTLTIQNGTIESTTRGGSIGTVTNSGTLTVAADATLKRTHASANITFSAINNKAGTATVYGTLESDGNGINAAGTVIVEDGAKITTNHYGINVASNGNVTVKGGEIIGNTSAVQVTKGALTVTGSTFDVKGEDKRYMINCIDDNYNSGAAVVSITGGTFVGFDPSSNAAEGADTDFVAKGYVANKNAEGKFVVTLATVTKYGCSITLGGKIGVNYYMILDEATAADPDAYIEFTVESVKGSTRVLVSEAQKVESNGKVYHVFPCEINAAQMTKVITGTVYSGDGKQVSTAHTYTVQRYCNGIIANDDRYSKETVDVVKALRTYGSAAQQMFPSVSGNSPLADPDYTGVAVLDADLAVTYAPKYSETTVSGIRYEGASVWLESNTEISHYFTLTGDKSIDAYTFKVYGLELFAPQPTTIPGTDTPAYRVTIPDIGAHRLDDMIRIEVSDGTDTYWAEYSVYTYIGLSQEQENQDVKVLNVTRALYWYSKAVLAYKSAQ